MVHIIRYLQQVQIFNNIYVVDTKTTTRGMVYLLESAIEQINNDISLDVVADNLREQVKKNIYFCNNR